MVILSEKVTLSFFFFFFASLLSRDGGQLLKEVQCPKEHIPSFKSRLHIKELHNISHLGKVMQKLSWTGLNPNLHKV